MATAGDIIKVDLHGTYLFTNWINTFFYRLEDVPTDGYLDGLATEFQSTVMTALDNRQATQVSYTSLKLRNLFDDVEQEYTALTPSAGANPTANPVASIIALSVKLVRSNTRVRNGRKSFLGHDEANISGQEFLPVYVLGWKTDMAVLAASLNPGGVDLFKPVIVGRVLVPATEENKEFYRLPVSQAEMGDRWAYVTGVKVSPYVRTMNSRRPD